MLKQVKEISGLIVPDVSRIAREMTEKTQIAIIVDIVKLLSFMKLLYLGIRNIPNLISLLKKDYATGVVLLAELEYLSVKSKGKEVNELVLHSQMTDMALLLGNEKVFTGFLNFCKWYKVRPALMSNNPMYCMQMLSSLSFLPQDLILYFSDDRNASIEEFANTSSMDIRVISGSPRSRG